MKPLSRGEDITRYAMYRQVAEAAAQLESKSGRVLSISESLNLVDVMGIKPTEIVPANYPEHSLLSLAFAENSFDFVLSDQVLEHIEGDPFQAVAECKRVLRDGGVALHTTCFINPIHHVPGDFWRFTPEALELMHQDWSQVIAVGGWGNFEVWSLVQDGIRYAGVPHARWHPVNKIATKNDPLWPIVTWIQARK